MKTCGLIAPNKGEQVNHSDFFINQFSDWFEMMSQVRPNDVITSEFGWPA